MVKRSPFEPGTRSMSPKEQKITSGRRAMTWALSIISSGVTQTEQPGPCTSWIPGGKRRSMPFLTMEWVCPPQTSMMTQGLVCTRWISSTIFRATRPSRYSSRYFIGALLLATLVHDRRVQLSELVQLFQHLIGARGFFLIYLADGKADVHQDVFADPSIGHVVQAC